MADGDDTYLLAASLYIHMNPVRAGLASDPRSYRWSSINVFQAKKPLHSFVNADFILRLLGSDLQEQMQIYGELLMKSMSMKLENVLEQEYAVRSFRGMLEKIFPKLFSTKGKSDVKESEIIILDEESLEAKIAEVKEGKIGTKPETMAARRFLIEQLVARGYGRKTIADRLGLSVKTVYNTLKVPC